MAADQERAARIDGLKEQRPDLTWREIANQVGVSERSAYNWKVSGGIDYENAKKLALIFEVDVDYIWRGPVESERAPSPFGSQDALADRLDVIEAKLNQILSALGGEAGTLDRIRRDLHEGGPASPSESPPAQSPTGGEPK